MNWNITAGRPVYVRWSSSWSLPSSQGSSRPAAAFRPCGSWPLTPGSTPTPCSALCRSWKAAAFCRRSAPPGAPSQRMTLPCRPCAVGRAGTLAAEFLHQMQALGLTEAEIETLLRESAQQAPKKE